MLETALDRPQFRTTRTSPNRRSRAFSLQDALESLVLVHPSTEILPHDNELADLATQLRIAPDLFVSVDVLLDRRPVSIVCLVKTAWDCHKAAFLELKAVARAKGQKVILIPQRFVRREPRLSNCLLIAEAAASHITPSERMSILAHLIDYGGDAPLSDLAVLVRGPDPVSAILGLIVEGGLYMDLDRPITHQSVVFLVQP